MIPHVKAPAGFAGQDRVDHPQGERLSEARLLQYAGSIDGALCGKRPLHRPGAGRAALMLKGDLQSGAPGSTPSTGAQRLKSGCATRRERSPRRWRTPSSAYLLSFATAHCLDGSRHEGWPLRKAHDDGTARCTLGVVGVGRIGKAVLRRAARLKCVGSATTFCRWIRRSSVSSGLRCRWPTLTRQSDFVSRLRLEPDLAAADRGSTAPWLSCAPCGADQYLQGPGDRPIRPDPVSSVRSDRRGSVGRHRG
jgi:hypothetical protein